MAAPERRLAKYRPVLLHRRRPDGPPARRLGARAPARGPARLRRPVALAPPSPAARAPRALAPAHAYRGTPAVVLALPRPWSSLRPIARSCHANRPSLRTQTGADKLSRVRDVAM